ncbi:diguanylate cyclase [Neptunicella marina]|uniref:Sensor domain-containing diguanylate cyclase n=1 Tax=Neptunicella marina TaxID=2125989 RepID=A0A8J6M2V9_9ALTE|nr:sensor domain-containing diguanylate cyclase [Neptunicella marina]
MPDKTHADAIQSQLLQLHATLDHVGAYVFTKDIQGRYTYANQKVCELFGVPLEQILGKKDDEFFDLEKYNQLAIHDQKVLQQGKKIEGEEVNRVGKSDELMTFWTVKSPLYDQQGNIIGLSGISTDITERRKMEQALRDQQVLLNTVLDNSDSYIYMKDKDCRFLYANSNVCQLFALPVDEIIGKQGSDILPKEVAENFDVLDRQVVQSGEKMYGEENFFDEDGHVRHYWSVKIPLFKHNEVYAFVGISTDITDIVKMKEDFKVMANTDSLTGICSRRYLIDCAKREIKRVQRNKKPLAVIIFDIDHFKTINDTCGHGSGDKTIKDIVNVCKAELREIDIFGRLGGDEFVVITPETAIEDAIGIAERLRNAVHSVKAASDKINISCSFGVADWKGEEFFDEWLFRADAALYNAKQSGRNCVKFQE